MDLKTLIQDIPDFPKPGIVFKDMGPLLRSTQGYRQVIDTFAERYRDTKIDIIIGIESRGFLFASALAYVLELPLALVRKPGKLPGPKVAHEYVLEYGTDILELRQDAVSAGSRVLLMDDLLATGGTVLAASHLIEKMGGTVAEIAMVVELADLKGRARLDKYKVYSQIIYGLD